jgi:DNA repair protein RadC
MSTNSCERENRFADLKPSALSEVEKRSVVTLALAILKQRHRKGRALGSPDDTRAYLRLKLAERKNEVFGVVLLTNRHQVIDLAELFQGTVDGASVYPRVVVQKALETNAAAVVFFHSHPSGVAEPSHADEAITRKLRDALALIEVRVLDHFVVAAGECVSFAGLGLL